MAVPGLKATSTPSQPEASRNVSARFKSGRRHPDSSRFSFARRQRLTAIFPLISRLDLTMVPLAPRRSQALRSYTRTHRSTLSTLIRTTITSLSTLRESSSFGMSPRRLGTVSVRGPVILTTWTESLSNCISSRRRRIMVFPPVVIVPREVHRPCHRPDFVVLLSEERFGSCEISVPFEPARSPNRATGD